MFINEKGTMQMTDKNGKPKKMKENIVSAIGIVRADGSGDPDKGDATYPGDRP